MKNFQKKVKKLKIFQNAKNIPNFEFWKNLKNFKIYIFFKFLAAENNMSFLLEMAKTTCHFSRKIVVISPENDVSFLPEMTKTTCCLQLSSLAKMAGFDPFLRPIDPIQK